MYFLPVALTIGYWLIYDFHFRKLGSHGLYIFEIWNLL